MAVLSLGAVGDEGEREGCVLEYLKRLIYPRASAVVCFFASIIGGLVLNRGY
jgi:hypothetical protein